MLPAASLLLPVGSISPLNMQTYFDADANCSGIGSALYKSGNGAYIVKFIALKFIAACARIEGVMALNDI